MPVGEAEPLPLNTLTAICTLDGRYRKNVADLAPYASEFGIIRARFEVESQYLIALSQLNTNKPLVRPLGDQEHEFLNALGPNMSLEQAQEVKTIEDTTHHDVKAVEMVFRKLLSGTSMADLVNSVHILATSEDINNLVYRLLVQRATDKICIPALDGLVDHIAMLAGDNRLLAMKARTHGQAAVPTTLGKEMANFAERLDAQARSIEERQLTGKFNGAVGNYNSFDSVRPDIDWISFTRKFVSHFGFKPKFISTQINPYDDMVKTFQEYQLTNNILRGDNQDMWRYISDNYFKQIPRAGEVGSSTMPQKVNPIYFERSEGNLEIANGILSVLINELPVSRLQRDLSDSTVVRCFGMGLGFSLLAYRNALEGFKRVQPNDELIKAELNVDWSILGEPVQQFLREAGFDDPYTMVKDVLRGNIVSEQEWRKWLRTGLPNVDPSTRRKIRELSPQTYIGKAPQLADMALANIAESRSTSRLHQAAA